MGDKVHFSVNGIFTGFETLLLHIFFFCLKDFRSSAILTEMLYLCVCMCVYVCVCVDLEACA